MATRTQGKEAHKRTWRRKPRKRTLWSKMWDRTGFRNKTLWDWLQLLVVPLVLVVVGFTLTSAQQDVQQQMIEEQRAQTEFHLEEQRAQDATLQAYLDVMRELLLDGDLRSSRPDSSVRAVANVQTLIALERLDGVRDRAVLRLLNDSGLIEADAPIIDLEGANVDGVVLSGMDFSQADLSEADLSNSHLIAADLRGAMLRDANLTGAYLDGANLRGAEGVTKEQLEQEAESLQGATMPDGTKHP